MLERFLTQLQQLFAVPHHRIVDPRLSRDADYDSVRARFEAECG